MSAANKNRADIYQKVTDSILCQLERGVRPWHKPWDAKHAAGKISRPLRHNGTPYQGINILMLWAAAEAAGHHLPYWLTFKQAKELGGHVRKGEHGAPVVFASTFTKRDTDDDGSETEQKAPFLKQYRVFNSCQIDGLPDRYYQLADPPREQVERIEQADRFFAATGAEIRTGGNKAFYSASADRIQMPPIECFRDSESHSATLAHEICHWTKHPSRLNRQLGGKRWGDAGYAMEELVAELGAAFLCADLAITPEVRDDHASYLGHWLNVLKSDKRAIFSAASFASKAVDYLYQPDKQSVSLGLMSGLAEQPLKTPRRTPSDGVPSLF